MNPQNYNAWIDSGLRGTAEGSSPRLVSVLIPCYEMQGIGASMLERALNSLVVQQLGPLLSLEVVVSDQSADFVIRDWLREQLDGPYRTLSISYTRPGPGAKSASANLNHAFYSSTGDLIKILFQDDFLIAKDALWLSLEPILSGATRWSIAGSVASTDGHRFSHEMIPRIHDRIHLGENTVSSPSVVALRRETWLGFDQRLKWLMDVDFYKRMLMCFGEPAVVRGPLVANGVGSHQLSETGISKARIKNEVVYSFIKHSVRRFMKTGKNCRGSS